MVSEKKQSLQRQRQGEKYLAEKEVYATDVEPVGLVWEQKR